MNPSLKRSEAMSDRMPDAREMRGLGPSEAQLRAQRTLQKQRAAAAKRAREEAAKQELDAERRAIAYNFERKIAEAADNAQSCAKRGLRHSGVEIDHDYTSGDTSLIVAELVRDELRSKGYRAGIDTETIRSNGNEITNPIG
jgi:hypothetical protein